MFIFKGFINFCRSSVLASVAIVILIGVIFMAVFADIITPHDPLKAYFTDLKKPPSAEFLMGTDHIGRDVLSRIILGSRITIYVAIMSIFFGCGIGFIWGVTTGFFGGKLDLFSQRILDILMAFPTVILALLVLASIGAGLTSVIIAIAISSVPNATRIIRSVSLSVSEMAYVDAARAIGANPI